VRKVRRNSDGFKNVRLFHDNDEASSIPALWQALAIATNSEVTKTHRREPHGQALSAHRQA
jgi:hypothetical protein